MTTNGKKSKDSCISRPANDHKNQDGFGTQQRDFSIDKRSNSSVALRSQGEMEAEACDVIRRYSIERLGRGPRDVKAYLVSDMLLIRIYGVLTVIEQYLSKSGDEKSLQRLKQTRAQLIQLAREELFASVRLITQVGVINLHHDISTATGEEVIVFTLSQVPLCRRSTHTATRG